MEALLEYNNVFKEAHPDRPIEDLKSEAKKACLEAFMKCSRSKKGNPDAFNRFQGQLFENFRQKDNIIKGIATQPKLK